MYRERLAITGAVDTLTEAGFMSFLMAMPELMEAAKFGPREVSFIFMRSCSEAHHAPIHPSLSGGALTSSSFPPPPPSLPPQRPLTSTTTC